MIMQVDLEAAIDKAMTAGEPPVPDAPKAEVEDRIPVKSPAAKEPERKTLTTATRCAPPQGIILGCRSCNWLYHCTWGVTKRPWAFWL